MKAKIEMLVDTVTGLTNVVSQQQKEHTAILDSLTKSFDKLSRGQDALKKKMTEINFKLMGPNGMLLVICTS